MASRDKQNITTIIHDLKTSYSKTFREKFDQNNLALEQVLIQAAKEVKQGKQVTWILDSDGNRSLKIESRSKSGPKQY